MRLRTNILLTGLLVLGLVAAACGEAEEATTTTTTAVAAPAPTDAPEDPIVVGVPALIATHPFYVEQYRYFQHEADRQGAELVIVDSAPTKEVNEVQMLMTPMPYWNRALTRSSWSTSTLSPSSTSRWKRHREACACSTSPRLL